MNKKILTALAAATITSLAISAPFVGAKKTVNKPASLIALQEEIQANHDRYAASAKALPYQALTISKMAPQPLA